MVKNTEITDISLWRNVLGLLPVNLFSDFNEERTYVLLNGSEGNFCLDLGNAIVGDQTRNNAWSSNVGYYVAVSNDYVELQRWDKKPSVIERYSKRSVSNELEKFYEYLEKATFRSDISVVAHSIRIFRKLRAVLGESWGGGEALTAFLYLLACATDHAERRNLEMGDWMLSEHSLEIAESIRNADWIALQKELLMGRQIDNLTPNLDLLLRHASGQLFQEAHYEATFYSAGQLMLNGFLPSPVSVRRETEIYGLHFTPASLVRTLVEEALDKTKELRSLLVFDPACGSGEFLRETLRQLKIIGFTGRVRIVGWDLSQAACSMANFILAWEKRGFNAEVDVEISCLDSLGPDSRWPENVDIVLMNPPFVSWQDMKEEQRATVTKILGKLVTPRPDLSYAFLWKATNSLRNGGVLGSILPASFLDSRSAQELRNMLSEQLSAKLIARLGSHLLFSNATIDAAIYFAKKERSNEPSLALWADYRSSSSSAGLRALRRVRHFGQQTTYPIVREGFSIYPHPEIGRGSKSWAPRPYESWKLLRSLDHMPRVKDIFNVMQGARTGLSKIYLIDKHQWENLPENERAFFRPAVVNRSIQFGYLKKLVYIFYPYGEYRIKNEDYLGQQLPSYFEHYLLPNKEKLLSRAGINIDRWWELTRHRAWQVRSIPKLLSTYFGDSGSFAWDASGDFVVVQGNGWLPKNSVSKTVSPKVGLAYLAILNSAIFSELLSATSNHVGGGQWNLSKKFVNLIPIPNLFGKQSSPRMLNDLASIGKSIHGGFSFSQNNLDELSRAAYGF